MRKSKYRDYVKNVAVPCLVYGAFTGAAVGTLVFFFRFAAERLMEISAEIYGFVRSNPAYIPLLAVALAALAVLMSLVLKWAPETKGGGIPRAEGVLRGILTFRWLRTGIAVVVNSFMSFFAGLPLGSEGPSVLLGTAIGGGTCRLPLSHDSWNRYIMTGGACAGFAVATNAPLTGILFALEEAHKRFTPMILLMAISSVLFGTAVSTLWADALGHSVSALFNVGSIMGNLQLKDIWVPVLLGVAVGVAACAYNKTVFAVGRLYDTALKKIPQWLRLVIVFLLTGAIGLIAAGGFTGTDALYGGAGLIVKLTDPKNFLLGVLFAVLLIRFFMIALSTGSGATGGVFIPMLSVGALIGALMGRLFLKMGMDESLYATVVMISMSAFMGASTRAPITAMVFVVECTWNFTNLFYVGVTVFISFIICEIVKVDPLYDVLLERMTEKQYEGQTHKITRFVYTVQEGAFAVGKSVRDILWPANTKVREIVADDKVKRMDDDGEKKIYIGDRVTLQVQTYDEQATRTELDDILGVQPRKQTKTAAADGSENDKH